MKNFKFKDNFLLLSSAFLILAIIIFFFIGFYNNENSAGGGGYNVDLASIWNNHKIFQNNNLLKAIIHEDYFDSRPPTAYILHKYLNPYIYNIESYRNVVFILSFLLPIIFFINLKKKFNHSNILLLLLSCNIFLSPYFRTSSFWGLEENYGLICLVISSLFLTLYKERNSYTNIFVICTTSSFAIYFDQKLLIIPLLCLISILNNSDIKRKIFSIFLYSTYALPFIGLILIWGGVTHPGASHRNFIFFWPNIAYAISIIAFCIFPMVFFKKNLVFDLKNFLNFNNISLIIIFIIYLGFFLYNFQEIESTNNAGNGVIDKLSKIIFEDILLKKLFLFFAFVSSFILILFFFSSLYERLIILYLLTLGLILNPIYQEYFDPLVFLLIFTFFKDKIQINHKSVFSIILYNSIYLFCAIYYYKGLNL